MRNVLAFVLVLTASLGMFAAKYHQWLAEELGWSDAAQDMWGFVGGLLTLGGLAVFIFAPNWKRPGGPK